MSKKIRELLMIHDELTGKNRYTFFYKKMKNKNLVFINKAEVSVPANARIVEESWNKLIFKIKI